MALDFDKLAGIEAGSGLKLPPPPDGQHLIHITKVETFESEAYQTEFLNIEFTIDGEERQYSFRKNLRDRYGYGEQFLVDFVNAVLEGEFNGLGAADKKKALVAILQQGAAVGTQVRLAVESATSKSGQPFIKASVASAA